MALRDLVIQYLVKNGNLDKELPFLSCAIERKEIPQDKTLPCLELIDKVMSSNENRNVNIYNLWRFISSIYPEAWSGNWVVEIENWNTVVIKKKRGADLK